MIELCVQDKCSLILFCEMKGNILECYHVDIRITVYVLPVLVLAGRQGSSYSITQLVLLLAIFLDVLVPFRSLRALSPSASPAMIDMRV